MADPVKRGRSGHRVLVTGAFGFVGRWLTAELLARDPDLAIVGWGLHGETQSNELERVTGATVDLTDHPAVLAAVERAAPTAIVHLAAVSAPREAMLDPRRAWDVNLFGTLNLAEAVLAKAAQARFVYISSSEVYGGSFSRMTGALDETAALDPLNVYALTKSAADLAVGKLVHDGLQAVRFRPFNHTGPGQSDAFVVASLASQIAKIEAGASPTLYVGNTDVSRDLLDVRDVVRAYASAVLQDDLGAGEIINLAHGRSFGIGEIADRLCSLAKVKIGIEVDPGRVRSNDQKRTLGNAARARALLGWEPQIDIDRTLSDVLDYWRERVLDGARQARGHSR